MAEYNGTVTLIAGITQANGQNFALVNAPDVQIDNTDKRLPAALDEKANKENTVLTTYLSRGRKADTDIGTGSFAFGVNVTASGSYSHAEGNQTVTRGQNGHSEGFMTYANGTNSHAEGNSSGAVGQCSHAENFNTTANGYWSHAEGNSTIAQNMAQHVFGEYNISDPSGNPANERGTYVEIVGNGAAGGNRSNARVLDWEGNEYLKGNLFVNCNADSSGGTSLTNLLNTKADKDNPVFTGTISRNRSADSIVGGNSTAIGNNCTASGAGSYAEGYNTIAVGEYSHAQGNSTIVNGAYSTVLGEYNVEEVIPTTWSNWISNSNYTPGRRVKYSTTTTSAGITRYTRVYAYCIKAHTSGSSFFGDSSNWRYISSQSFMSPDSFEDPVFNTQIEIVGNGAQDHGRSNARMLDKLGNEYLMGDLYINCDVDSTNGTSVKTTLDNIMTIKADVANPEFTGSISLGRQDSIDKGAGSIATGAGVIAKGKHQHVSGTYNVDDFIKDYVSGTTYYPGDVVAKVYTTLTSTASINYTYVYLCLVENSDQRTNRETLPSAHWKLLRSSNGTYSAAQLYKNSRFAEIVGSGTSDSARANVRALDWEGNEYLKGDLYVGCSNISMEGTKVVTITDLNTAIGNVASTEDIDALFA